MADYSAHEKDRRMLHALGYAQELRRGMSGFSNFAISFTIISILSGTLTLYATGINYGGPVEEAWGWPIVSIFLQPSLKSSRANIPATKSCRSRV